MPLWISPRARFSASRYLKSRGQLPPIVTVTTNSLVRLKISEIAGATTDHHRPEMAELVAASRYLKSRGQLPNDLDTAKKAYAHRLKISEIAGATTEPRQSTH